MSEGILAVVNEMVGEDKQTQSLIAVKVGKAHSTLQRELNPFDKGAKLGVETLIPLMLACGSAKPLEFIAAAMGYAVVPVGALANPDGANMAEECLQVLPRVTEFARVAMDKQAAPREIIPQYMHLRKEMVDVVCRFYEERGKPAPDMDKIEMEGRAK